MKAKFLTEAAQMHRGPKFEFSDYRIWYQAYLLGCWILKKFVTSCDPFPRHRTRLAIWLLSVTGAGIAGGMLLNPLEKDISYLLFYGAFFLITVVFFFIGDDDSSGTSSGCFCLGIVFVPIFYSFNYSQDVNRELAEKALFANLVCGMFLGGMLSYSIPEFSMQVGYAVLGALCCTVLGFLLSPLLTSYRSRYLRMRQKMREMGVNYGGPD